MSAELSHALSDRAHRDDSQPCFMHRGLFLHVFKEAIHQKQGNKELTQVERQLTIPQHHARKMPLAHTEELPLHSPLQIRPPGPAQHDNKGQKANLERREKAGELGGRKTKKHKLGGTGDMGGDGPETSQEAAASQAPNGSNSAKRGGRGRGGYCSG